MQLAVRHDHKPLFLKVLFDRRNQDLVELTRDRCGRSLGPDLGQKDFD